MMRFTFPLVFLPRNNQSSASLSDLYVDANVNVQTSTSKSLPNTPKNEQMQVTRRRTRASSAVLNPKHRIANKDFHGLDAYLERKRMEKRSSTLLQDLASSNASNTYGDEEEEEEEEEGAYDYADRRPTVPNRAETRLHDLSNDPFVTFPNSLAVGTQNEGKSKFVAGRYWGFFPFLKSLRLLENSRVCEKSFVEFVLFALVSFVLSFVWYQSKRSILQVPCYDDNFYIRGD